MREISKQEIYSLAGQIPQQFDATIGHRMPARPAHLAI
jgi:hypothetical protein